MVPADAHTERNILQILNRCQHFNGFSRQETCGLGLDVVAMNGGTANGIGRHLPCLRDYWDGTVSCPSASYATREEAEAEEARRKQYIADWTKSVFEEHTCPSCAKHWAGEQVGPCVYCEHCGHRLYQGKLP